LEKSFVVHGNWHKMGGALGGCVEATILGPSAAATAAAAAQDNELADLLLDAVVLRLEPCDALMLRAAQSARRAEIANAALTRTLARQIVEAYDAGDVERAAALQGRERKRRREDQRAVHASDEACEQRRIMAKHSYAFLFAQRVYLDARACASTFDDDALECVLGLCAPSVAIVAADLAGCALLTDAGIEKLACYAGDELHEWASDVTRRARIASARSRQLSHVDLAGCVRVTDRGVAALVRRCPALERLNLARCAAVVAAERREISGLFRLRRLRRAEDALAVVGAAAVDAAAAAAAAAAAFACDTAGDWSPRRGQRLPPSRAECVDVFQPEPYEDG